jgi:hypothetical protein
LLHEIFVVQKILCLFPHMHATVVLCNPAHALRACSPVSQQ